MLAINLLTPTLALIPEDSLFGGSPILLAAAGGLAALLVMVVLQRIIGVAMIVVVLVTLVVAASLYFFGPEKTKEYAEQVRDSTPGLLEEAMERAGRD